MSNPNNIVFTNLQPIIVPMPQSDSRSILHSEIPLDDSLYPSTKSPASNTGLVYPSRHPSETLEDYKLLETPQPTSMPPSHQYNTDNFNRPDASPTPELYSSPNPTTTSLPPVPDNVPL
ncbi:hypothetical protein Moror_14768 [Moniliophthora roreri MCA 2997]|uniref:Uncharacterized protein n=1 Tax=Moniliophthora roreri (strain MCA 2997) TaxID=1381753 RepID=V2X3K2_MONRO|nr:hypothetical protein Moror_14768 [Moniliophthora roreri MCA 2997]